MNLVALALLIALGINLVLFVPAYRFKTDKLTDFSYALSFAVVAVAGYAMSSRTAMHLTALYMILLWSSRLGGFLVQRIKLQGRDSRFDEMREHFWQFLKFWVAQGISVFVILLSGILLWQQPAPHASGLSLLGFLVFCAGVLLEATADKQKLKFNITKRSNIWIDSGIWRISRHPNYLGEITVWVGMYLFVVSTLNHTGQLVALVSPLFITSLLLFVSGIPILEKNADKKWGSRKAYQQYKKQVPVLIPTPRSLVRLFAKSR